MVKAMEKIRSFLVRGLAVITVVLTYALGTVGTQVLSVAGISAVRVTATATPANAWRRFRHRRFFPHRRFFRPPRLRPRLGWPRQAEPSGSRGARPSTARA